MTREARTSRRRGARTHRVRACRRDRPGPSRLSQAPRPTRSDRACAATSSRVGQWLGRLRPPQAPSVSRGIRVLPSHRDRAPDRRRRVATRSPDLRRFRVSVVGSTAAAEADASTSELTIGSAPGNQLALDDPTVSRHHCAIRVTPRGFQLLDLGSTNGTWLGEPSDRVRRT